MKNIAYLFIMAVSIVSVGCSTPSQRLASFLRYPAEPNYKIIEMPMPEMLPIDIGVVYVQKRKSSPEDEGYFKFLRFWPDGRCFVSSIAYPSLNRDIVDKIEGGQAGYYRIDGNTIYIETLSPEWRGSYHLMRGVLLKSDTGEMVIRIMEERYRGGFSLSLVPRVYRYPYFENPRFIRSDFYPVDFGPLKSKPMWPVDPRAEIMKP